MEIGIVYFLIEVTISTSRSLAYICNRFRFIQFDILGFINILLNWE